ncbi:hypothetical protein J6590_012838 [Homalodisca vitripennis]|nr:hypothetical protein J6590_012838 [Homalodisca vitripennis]
MDKQHKDKAYLSLAMEEFLDMDFGDISKKDSRRWGRFCSTSPAEGEAPPSRGDLPGDAPFSTSKLKHNTQG